MHRNPVRYKILDIIKKNDFTFEFDKRDLVQSPG